MRAPSDQELLSLWDRCLERHPIDRSLMLCAWAQDEFPAHSLADKPLGAITRTLLRWRLAWLGSRIGALVTCPACAEQLDLVVEGEQLLEGLAAPSDPPPPPSDGVAIRPVTSRDLAAVSHCADAATAGRALLERCLVTAEDQPPASITTLPPGKIATLEAELEAIDPAADIGLVATCDGCGHSWVAGLDIGALLWEEICFRVRALLYEVDALARAYGWSETEILAIRSRRRAIYLELAQR
jgi:hypothetical protein